MAGKKQKKVEVKGVTSEEANNFDILPKTQGKLKKIFDEKDGQNKTQESHLEAEEYKRSLPFSGENDTMPVTKEEREARREIHKEEQKQREEVYKTIKKARQELQDLGYIGVNEEDARNRPAYAGRLKQVLGQKQITNINQIPTHQEIENPNTGLQLFTSLQRQQIDPEQEHYYKQLTKVLDKYEKDSKYRLLKDSERDEIMRIFIVGNINAPELFYRFEQLKKQSNIYHYQRILWYGRHLEHSGTIDENTEKTPFLDAKNMQILIYYIKGGPYTIKDIEPDMDIFWKRIGDSYKYDVKCKIGRKSDRHRFYNYTLSPDKDIYSTIDEKEKSKIIDKLSGCYRLNQTERRSTMLDHERNSIILAIRKNKNLTQLDEIEGRKIRYWEGFYSHALQKHLGVSRDTLNTWITEAKREFILAFPGFVDQLSTDFLSSLKNIGGIIDSYPIDVSQLPIIRKKIQQALPHYEDIKIDVVETETKLIQKLTQCLQDSMQKIKNKEKKTSGFEYKQRKSMGYKAQLEVIVKDTDTIDIALKGLGVSNEVTLDRGTNKEKYQEEYCKHFRDQFVEKRVADVLQENDVTSKDPKIIKDMIIRNGAPQLIECCLHHLAGRKYHEYDMFSTYKSMSSRTMFTCIKQGVLFRSGYSTLMKHVCPDDKQRKAFRREVVQGITKKCIEQIGEKLLHEETFEEILYHLIEPLTYRYKKYQGAPSTIRVESTIIKENYLNILGKELQNKNNATMISVEKKLQKKEVKKEEIIKSYEDISGMLNDIDRYFFIFFRKNSIDLRKKYGAEENKNFDDLMGFWKEKNKEYENEYPKAYTDILCLRRYAIVDLEKYLPHNIQLHLKKVFEQISILREGIWTYLLQTRFNENAMSGGKLNRILDEQIFKEFGLVNYTQKEQIDFAIDYIINNIQTIILSDIKMDTLKGNDIFRTDKDIIEKILQNFLDLWRQGIDQRRGLTDNNTLEITG